MKGNSEQIYQLLGAELNSGTLEEVENIVVISKQN